MFIAVKLSVPVLVRGAIAALACVADSLGCVVSESKYDSKIEELDTCKTERDEIALERNQLRDRVPEVESQMKEELSATQEELEALRQQRKELDKQLEEYQKLTQRFQDMVSTQGIKVDVRRGRLIVSLPSSVLFASGKAEISPGGRTALTQVAGKLKDFTDRRFIVAGHTDNVPIGKTPDIAFTDNWDLSTARALNVTRFLIEQGLEPQNLAAAGYGQHDPVRNNRKPAGRRFNRRIELILEPKLPDFRKLTRLSQKVEAITGAGDEPDPDAPSEEAAAEGEPESQP